MRVLSIDFDYFQNVSYDTLIQCYPDGVDVPTWLSIITWAGNYSNPITAEKLSKVTIRRKELCELKRLIKQQSSKCPVLITNSHKYIYNFIKKDFKKRKNNELWVTNIDMHHDMFNEDDVLGCGNWVSHIKKEFANTTLEWVAPKKALAIFDNIPEELSKSMKYSIGDIKHNKFDIIFLCRSDNWLPPHLDIEFDKLLKMICKHFDKVEGEPTITYPREYQEAVKKEKELFYRVIEKGNPFASCEVGE